LNPFYSMVPVRGGAALAPAADGHLDGQVPWLYFLPVLVPDGAL